MSPRLSLKLCSPANALKGWRRIVEVVTEAKNAGYAGGLRGASLSSDMRRCCRDTRGSRSLLVSKARVIRPSTISSASRWPARKK